MESRKTICVSHLKTHEKSVENLPIHCDELLEKLKSNIGEVLSNFIVVHLNNVLRYTNTQQLSIKDKKLFYLKKKILPTNAISSATVFVIDFVYRFCYLIMILI